MTGPEHYAKAEGMIRSAAQMAARTRGADRTPEELRDLKDSVDASLAAAQVHATLALAAVTATLIPVRDGMGHDNANRVDQWRQAGAL